LKIATSGWLFYFYYFAIMDASAFDRYPHLGDSGVLEMTMAAVKYLLREYRRPAVDFGAVYVSAGVAELMERHKLNPYVYLGRAAVQDWGEVCQEQETANAEALKSGNDVLAQYDLPESIPGHRELQIIIEPERSATTIKLAIE